MIQETWKDIPNYKGCYQVSDLGRVRSLSRRCGDGKKIKGKILKTCFNSVGYLVLRLSVNGSQKQFSIHQLVAMAFLGHTPCGHKVVVDHIDNNPQNNNLSNLQLISNRENCSKDRIGVSSKYTGVSWKKICNKWESSIEVDGKAKYLGLFDNEKDAAKAYQKSLKQLK